MGLILLQGDHPTPVGSLAIRVVLGARCWGSFWFSQGGRWLSHPRLRLPRQQCLGLINLPNTRLLSCKI